MTYGYAMAKKLKQSFWNMFKKSNANMENPKQEHIDMKEGTAQNEDMVNETTENKTTQEEVQDQVDATEKVSEEQEGKEEQVAEDKTNKKKRGSRSGSNAKKVKQLENEVEELEKEVVGLEEERNELKNKYVRLLAEFENYKRRTAKERMDILKTASSDVLRELLPVMDDFDRAKTAAGEEGLPDGIQLIYDKLLGNLSRKGLKSMESNGQPFDAELHEAITEIPAPTEEMKGKIIDTIEKGYTLNDKIIRYAKVVVGK